jgi:neuraminyllactose-binding hemagglutinin
MSKSHLSFCAAVGVIAFATFVVACMMPMQRATATPTLPVTRWGQNYAFNFETPPPAPPGSVDAAIIVVETEFWKTNIFSEETYRALGEGLARSMGIDLQKIVIGKGMTALGPYETYDEVVYGDKKAASLMLAPKLEIQLTVNYFSEATQTTEIDQAGNMVDRMSRDFEMKVSGYLTLVMMEPLSREKMWLKKLELTPVTANGKEQWEAIAETTPQYGLFGEVVGHTTTGWHKGQVTYDGKPEVLADAVKAFYQTVMGKCWTLIDPQEVVDLKATAQEIRDKAEYGARPSY